MQTWTHRFAIKDETWVYVPTEKTRNFGNRLVEFLSHKWNPPSYFYHLRDGGHVRAAKIHINSQYFCCIDLKGFFNSISRTRVTRALKTVVPYKVARQIAKESTVKNHIPTLHSHYIPFGYPQSPILASMCLDQSYVGSEMKNCFCSRNIKISLYMDDIVLSANNMDILKLWFERIAIAAGKSKFLINMEKTQEPNYQIEVFNLVLSNSNIKVNVDRLEQFKIDFRKGNDKSRDAILRYLGSINKIQADEVEHSHPTIQTTIR